MYHALGEFQYWVSTLEAFDPYDVVILDPGTTEYESLRLKAKPGHPLESMVHTYSRDFLVLAKTPNTGQLNRR